LHTPSSFFDIYNSTVWILSTDIII
jgi:hypothetical protein